MMLAILAVHSLCLMQNMNSKMRDIIFSVLIGIVCVETLALIILAYTIFYYKKLIHNERYNEESITSLDRQHVKFTIDSPLISYTDDDPVKIPEKCFNTKKEETSDPSVEFTIQSGTSKTHMNSKYLK